MDDELPLLEIQMDGSRYLVHARRTGQPTRALDQLRSFISNANQAAAEVGAEMAERLTALERFRAKVKQLMNEGTDDEVRAYASVLKLMDKEGL